MQKVLSPFGDLFRERKKMSVRKIYNILKIRITMNVRHVR